MKVAYFLGALNRGGAESLILDICRQHNRVPYDFICVYRHEGNMSDAFREAGASMIQIRKKLGFLRYLWNIRRTLLQEHITMVHSQTPSNTLLMFFALLGTGIEIITTFHGYNFSKAPWWQSKIVYSVSKQILCVSKHQKAWYETKWHLPKENKLQVVYNGIDFSKIDSAKPSLEFAESPQRNFHGKIDSVLQRRIRLAMVGNFVSVRSQNIIAKSIHLLHGQGIMNFEFYFIGRRDDKEAWRYDDCVKYCLEHKLSNVHFLGSRGDVPSLLKSMDGFVYSTEHDTFGIAVIEAIAAGLPIVVNDWPVMSEVCDLGLPKLNTAIRFFRTVDIEDCAEKMINLLDDIRNNKQQLKTYCIQASEAVKQKYSIQNHIEQIYKVYSQIDNR